MVCHGTLCCIKKGIMGSQSVCVRRALLKYFQRMYSHLSTPLAPPILALPTHAFMPFSKLVITFLCISIPSKYIYPLYIHLFSLYTHVHILYTVLPSRCCIHLFTQYTYLCLHCITNISMYYPLSFTDAIESFNLFFIVIANYFSAGRIASISCLISWPCSSPLPLHPARPCPSTLFTLWTSGISFLFQGLFLCHCFFVCFIFWSKLWYFKSNKGMMCVREAGSIKLLNWRISTDKQRSIGSMITKSGEVHYYDNDYYCL